MLEKHVFLDSSGDTVLLKVGKKRKGKEEEKEFKKEGEREGRMGVGERNELKTQ